MVHGSWLMGQEGPGPAAGGVGGWVWGHEPLNIPTPPLHQTEVVPWPVLVVSLFFCKRTSPQNGTPKDHVVIIAVESFSFFIRIVVDAIVSPQEHPVEVISPVLLETLFWH